MRVSVVNINKKAGKEKMDVGKNVEPPSFSHQSFQKKITTNEQTDKNNIVDTPFQGSNFSERKNDV